MTYKEKLLDPRWQRKRLEVLNRDNFTCRLCGDTETTLHVHHTEYIGEPWEVDDSILETYCDHCHTIVGIIKKDESFPNFKIDRILKIKKETGFLFLVEYNDCGEVVYHLFVLLDSRPIDYKLSATKGTLIEINSLING